MTTSAAAGVPVASMADRRATTDERVLRAAYACFARNGIAKTTIEDIAGEAGVSRPTVYKYYAGKEAILDEISSRETLAVHAEVRRKLVRHDNFADFLTDVLLLVMRTASSNVYIRRMTESREFQIHSMDRAGPMFARQREWWGRMLSHAADRGELATDLEADEVVLWLVHTQSQLLAYIEDDAIDDPALRRMIFRFVVEPLLSDPAIARR